MFHDISFLGHHTKDGLEFHANLLILFSMTPADNLVMQCECINLSLGQSKSYINILFLFFSNKSKQKK